MQLSKEEEQHLQKRNWIATILIFLSLSLFVIFVVRVMFLSQMMRSGTLDISTTGFSQSVSNVASQIVKQSKTVDQKEVTTFLRPFLGNKNAKIQIVEFADFGCPFSKEVSHTMRQFALSHPNDVYIEYRDFPILDLHPTAKKAAQAAKCGNKQGKFWQYHDKLYQTNGEFIEDDLLGFAKELNLDVSDWQTCLRGDFFQNEIEQDIKDGNRFGVIGTPTFFINGVKVDGAIPLDVLEKMYDTIYKE